LNFVLSYRRSPPFSGTDSYAFSEIDYKDFSIAHLTAFRCAADGGNSRFEIIIVDRYFESDLFNQVSRFTRSTVDFADPFLPAAAENVADGFQVNFLFIERFHYRIELVGLYDGYY
jgi:hypothetical protein